MNWHNLGSGASEETPGAPLEDGEMAYLLDSNDMATLVPGGLTGLDVYDELQRERRAREHAEKTAADLAELIAREHGRVAAAERELVELRGQIVAERERCDMLERQLGQTVVNDYTNWPPPPRWEPVKRALAR